MIYCIYSAHLNGSFSNNILELLLAHCVRHSSDIIVFGVQHPKCYCLFEYSKENQHFYIRVT